MLKNVQPLLKMPKTTPSGGFDGKEADDTEAGVMQISIAAAPGLTTAVAAEIDRKPSHYGEIWGEQNAWSLPEAATLRGQLVAPAVAVAR